jgi:hypothetical protein
MMANYEARLARLERMATPPAGFYLLVRQDAETDGDIGRRVDDAVRQRLVASARDVLVVTPQDLAVERYL